MSGWLFPTRLQNTINNYDLKVNCSPIGLVQQLFVSRAGDNL